MSRERAPKNPFANILYWGPALSLMGLLGLNHCRYSLVLFSSLFSGAFPWALGARTFHLRRGCHPLNIPTHTYTQINILIYTGQLGGNLFPRCCRIAVRRKLGGEIRRSARGSFQMSCQNPNAKCRGNSRARLPSMKSTQFVKLSVGSHHNLV